MAQFFHLYFFLDTSVWSVGEFPFSIASKMAQVLTPIAFQRNPEVTVCAGHRPMEVTVHIKVTQRI